jgi:glycosyltransferase involved in cell wall biosynthesis
MGPLTGDTPAPEVTVVIPAHNQPAGLARLLHSLDAQQTPPVFEVIVVDDCSTDDTARVAEEWAAGVRPDGATGPVAGTCHRHPVNRGPAAARNTGLRLARGRIVAFTDTDCVVGPDWLRRLTDALGGGTVGAGGPVLALEPAGVVGRYNNHYRILDPSPQRLYVVTANCCFLRKPLLEAGGFDETLPVPGGEDIGVCIRLWQRGGRFAVAEDAVVRHEFREDLRDFRRTWRRYGYGTAYVCRKYLGEHGEVSDRSALTEESGWVPNPLCVQPIALRNRWHHARAAWHDSRALGLGPRERLLFAWLRYLQMTIYPAAWGEGYQDGARDAEL